MQMVQSGAEGHPFPVRVHTGIDPVKFFIIDSVLEGYLWKSGCKDRLFAQKYNKFSCGKG